MERAPERESVEREIDHELAELLRSAEIAGAGQDGTVFRVSGERIPRTLLEKLKAAGEAAEVPDTFAAKMLKLYEPGMAERELRLQRKAGEVLHGVPDDPAHASIPRVYFIHTVSFSPEEHQQLVAAGIKVQERADVILMDYVPGRDLRRLLASEVMQRSEGASPEQVGRTTEAGSDHAYTFLEKRGFFLHPTIADQLEQTVRRLHQRAVYHHDLHEANVMVDGDPSMPDCRVAIIDFGRASEVQRHAYEEGERPIDDLAVVRRIRAHQPEHEGADRNRSDYREDLDRIAELAEQGDPRWKSAREPIAADPSAYLARLRAMNERDLSRAALGLIGGVRHGLFSPADASAAVRRAAERTTYAPVAQKLRWLSEYLQDIVRP